MKQDIPFQKAVHLILKIGERKKHYKRSCVISLYIYITSYLLIKRGKNLQTDKQGTLYIVYNMHIHVTFEMYLPTMLGQTLIQRSFH